jgi:hypothetical protein
MKFVALVLLGNLLLLIVIHLLPPPKVDLHEGFAAAVLWALASILSALVGSRHGVRVEWTDDRDQPVKRYLHRNSENKVEVGAATASG